MTTDDDDHDIQDFGRYGWRAVGTPKYADVAPHHTFGGSWSYVNTYDPDAEDLLRRIFDDRDPTAEAVVTVVWRGHVNGSGGKHYLLRSYSFSADEVPIPDACVVEFDADLTEDLEDDQVRQICWRAKVRGVRDEDAEH